MNSVLVAVFENEPLARRAMRRLDDMALNGAIDLYERSLIRKKLDGTFKVYKGDISAGWETLGGAFLGSLVGIPGGPPGIVAGLAAGAVIGSAISDQGQNEFGTEFLKHLETGVPPGSTLIVAHIGEKSPTYVDENLRSFGAEISRREISREIKKIES